ncbi:MAG: DUF402 domain-containing protein [Candidatus Limnocylindria bacterium]
MYPPVRVDKRHPDGTARASWYGYRLPDVASIARVYAPAGTRRLHVAGLWDVPNPVVTAFDLQLFFVPSRYATSEGPRIYIDIARDLRIDGDVLKYLDLYLDVMVDEHGTVSEKDEELLERLPDRDRWLARAARDEVRSRIGSGDRLLDPFSAFWSVPDDALALPPRMIEALPG